MAGRRIAIAAVIIVGVCEMLTTTPWITWNGVPGWLVVPVTMTGFLAFLVLFGFIGNAAVGILLIVGLRGGAGWPWWLAALAAAPYWIVFYRLCPKPW